MKMVLKYICAIMIVISGCATFIMRGSVAESSSPYGPSANALTPMAHTVFCIRYPVDCESTAATAALAIPADQVRELKSVNKAVNKSITSQVQDGRPIEKWLISPKDGDCNDYAVSKRHELLQKGWASSSLRLAEVTLIDGGEHHLILIVETATEQWVLDSLKRDVIPLADTKRYYVWNRMQSRDNPKFWTSAFPT